MAKKLTIKERKFIQEYSMTGNASRSAVLAGYSPNSARQIGSENLSKPHIQSALEVALANSGIDDGCISEAIARLLSSDKGADVARGVEIVLKIRGDEAPRKSVKLKMDYADYVKADFAERKEQE